MHDFVYHDSKHPIIEESADSPGLARRYVKIDPTRAMPCQLKPFCSIRSTGSRVLQKTNNISHRADTDELSCLELQIVTPGPLRSALSKLPKSQQGDNTHMEATNCNKDSSPDKGLTVPAVNNVPTFHVLAGQHDSLVGEEQMIHERCHQILELIRRQC